MNKHFEQFNKVVTISLEKVKGAYEAAMTAIAEAGANLERDYTEALRTTTLSALFDTGHAQGPAPGSARVSDGSIAKPKSAKAKKSVKRMSQDELDKIAESVRDLVVSAGKEGIGRSGIATKLNLDPMLASRVLKMLVETKIVKMHGEKRTAVYVAK